MSRALDFLLRERPQAMEAYFSFLRDAGSRLDPRTRALISVITKVATQTERGLVQYTRKALDTGLTSEEVLDALLAAFPALGLSRIVWAIETLIEHDVPGFAAAADAPRADDAAADSARIDCGGLEALPRGRAIRRGGDGRAVLLHRAEDDTVSAFKAYCTHHGMELTEQGIEGERVTCSLHGWQFALPDGTCVRGGRRALEALPVSIENGRVLVSWPGT
ncbi:MAG: Rieske 2Fe-2S domain-containing protein [Gammaproteobacteria bacterium]